MHWISRSAFQWLRSLSRVARPLLQRMIPWLMTHMSALLRAKRLLETDTLIAFHHPQSDYVVHILILPKAAIASLDEFLPAEHGQFVADLFQAVSELVDRFHLDASGYRLVLNGGDFQEIPHLHFHLISGYDASLDQFPYWR